MTADDVGYVMTSHHISMHKCLALGTIESADVNSPYRCFATRALLRSIIFIHTGKSVFK
ncbi:hypothetical protein BCR41DRAFT_346475 [Lobosporangium transversale]|uniref:Uncharacterized protein n=1 Tax=Lobosporangium transversale TaxID=64571 RepID=A0A1Y2GZL3_9FUNG|nr:hypothetical protein BCR41DRAFT_346475 [Lobosporangium transversale]ORZ27191.1 hypothetical protein BCR41DRAFT_346475 [Lobosporangium transversale]|eukprot:XP_021884918.1 hypothetical protein BCR41DRAFT_346475 [Lobosporangium transversale]